MTSHSDATYLGHMLDAARRAHVRALASTREQFDSDEDLLIVVTHFIRIIGEAARNVSEAMKAEHPEIPWSRIMGMRHRIVHNYFEIDGDILWRTATERLPELIAQLERITPPEPPSA